MIDKSIFAKAADYIEKNGWVQRSFYGANNAVCALGAVNLALGYKTPVGVNPYKPEATEYVEFVNKAAKRKARKVDVRCLTEWNDQPRRTKQQVVDFLRSLSK